MPRSKRPGASPSSARAWLTKASGCRVKAGTIDVPRVMRSVFMAAAPSRVSVSRAVAGIITQAVLTFARSARTHRSTTASALRGKMAIPTRSRLLVMPVKLPRATFGFRLTLAVSPSLIGCRRLQRDAMLPARLIPFVIERGLERLVLPGPGMVEDLLDGGRLLLGRHRHELLSDAQVLLQDGHAVDSGAEGCDRLRQGI